MQPPLYPSEPQTSGSSATATSSGAAFVETLEYRRFVEFCDACRRHRYIGLCYGVPGIGKTVSALRYSRVAESKGKRNNPEQLGAPSFDTVFYTASVINTPRKIEMDLKSACGRLTALAEQPLRDESQQALAAVRLRNEAQREDMERNHPALLPSQYPLLRPTCLEVYEKYDAALKALPRVTTLILIDEADRLRMASLEQIRANFDEWNVGLVLIGMPGLEKRMARYPQFYSRIGFVHEFRPLSAEETRTLLERHWMPPGVKLPDGGLASEAVAAIIRMTGGNFRLLHRLLTQIERILEINAIESISKTVVEAARESLVIGQA